MDPIRDKKDIIRIAQYFADRGQPRNELMFLIGCSEGLLPYGSPAPGDLLEEERRLMYVGITRAEDSLHLSYARGKDGAAAMQRSASRFLV